MTEDSAQAPSAQTFTHTKGQKTLFWVLWGILLLPVPILIFLVNGVGVILSVPQIIIHVFSLKSFQDASKPFSKAMLLLLGGTGALYFIVLGGCVIMLSSMMSSGGFH